MVVECPGQFLWACNSTDLFVEIGLIIVLMALGVMFFIFLYLRGEWGGLFYHSDKLQIGVEFQHEGSVDGYTLENFGAMKRIRMGKKKGRLIIPRIGAAFKAAKSPILSVILGRGIGLQVNPFLAPYIEQIGGKWPDWNDDKPPASPKDLDQLYLTYAKWKAGIETNLAPKERWVDEKMDTDPAPEGTTGNQLLQYLQEKRADLEAQYDQMAGHNATTGTFGDLVSQLEDPELKEEQRYGIYQFLNTALQSEPAEVWPSWIAGIMVDARQLAQFAEPIPASEMDSIIVSVQKAIEQDQKMNFVKFLAYGVFILMALVGAGIAYKLVAG